MRRIDTDLGRFYKDDDGNQYVGVTTVLEVAVSKTLKKYFTNNSAASQEKRLKETGATGTRLHEIMQADLMGEVVAGLNEAELKCFEQWLKLKKEEGIVAATSDIEVQVVSKLFGFAGTIDMIGMHKGRRCIMDIKTGSYSVKAGWQMAMYRLAFKEQYGELLPVVGLSIHRDGKPAKSFEYQHYEFTERMGLCCLEIFKGLYFTKLKEMGWDYLTENSLKVWLDTYYGEKK